MNEQLSMHPMVTNGIIDGAARLLYCSAHFRKARAHSGFYFHIFRAVFDFLLRYPDRRPFIFLSIS
jgi:hypothetical protein